jgi:nucleotide-binding universal stress UspA family protein
MDAVTANRNIAADQARPSRGPDGERSRVVVGVDGSPGGRTALAFALAGAARRGAALDVVAAYPVTLVWTGGVPLDIPDVDAVRADTERRARDLVDEVRQDDSLAAVPGVAELDVRLLPHEGRPVPALLAAAKGAELLVVGSRGRGAVRSALLGSVALHCVNHAPCPVLVVHPGASTPQPRRVVVGVDGSGDSRAALVTAMDEAVRCGAEVEVVVAYQLADYWTDLTSVIVPTEDQIRDGLQERTEDLVQGVLAERGTSGDVPIVRTRVVGGAAGDVLVGRARGADLLVVGSHGRGAVRGLVLGSVALHCALHASGPVMVVHPQQARTAVPQPHHGAVRADR